MRDVLKRGFWLGEEFNPREEGLECNAKMKIKQCTNGSTSTYRGVPGFWEEGITKLVAFNFQSWLALWCVDLSVPGAKEGVSVFLLTHHCWSPLIEERVHFFCLFFFRPSSSSFLFFLCSPKYLSHPFCPSCPLARSEVETCVSLHLHGKKGRKVKSDLSLSPSPPSLQRESRQTGA